MPTEEILLMRKISIVDDGTLDTVVECDGERFRYDSGYRFGFDNDAAFLDAIREEVEEELYVRSERHREAQESWFEGGTI